MIAQTLAAYFYTRDRGDGRSNRYQTRHAFLRPSRTRSLLTAVSFLISRGSHGSACLPKMFSLNTQATLSPTLGSGPTQLKVPSNSEKGESFSIATRKICCRMAVE